MLNADSDDVGNNNEGERDPIWLINHCHICNVYLLRLDSSRHSMGKFLEKTAGKCNVQLSPEGI